MKLYFSPGACSLSPHIVAREAQVPVEISKVTFNQDGSRTTEQGEDFFAVNNKGGYVPALRLDTNEVLAEGVAIVQYLADQAPEKSLMPEKGTMPYYRALEWLTFISSELHKGFGAFFGSDFSDDQKTKAADKLKKRFAYVDGALGGNDYLLGSNFSIADAYCYTILRWSPKASIDLSDFPNIVAFMARMELRDGVKKALEEEGLSAYAG